MTAPAGAAPFRSLPRTLFNDDTQPDAAPDAAPNATTASAAVAGADSAAVARQGDELSRIVEYLTEVARTRPVPLNVPLAFNALAFGYNPQTRRYTSELVDVDRLPLFALEQTLPVLPSGALARLATPGEPLPVEVVYREGEHLALQADGTLPAWLSGAPQGATGALRVAGQIHVDEQAAAPADQQGLLVRERLVPDVGVLQAGGLTRARRLDRRHLTVEQHVQVVSVYADAVQADLPESRLYARYLLERQRDLLVAVLDATGLTPVGETWEVAELEQLLASALTSIEVLLELSPLVQWRESWLHPQALTAFAAGAHGISAADVHRVSSGLARSALGRDLRGGLRLPDQPAYLALGPALRAEFSGTDAVRSVRYATTIACANLALVDQLQPNDGRVDVAGRAVHVGLDDAFQGGGIWRSEAVPAGAQDNLARDPVPVDLPLALGWRSAAAPAVPFQRDPLAVNRTHSTASTRVEQLPPADQTTADPPVDPPTTAPTEPVTDPTPVTDPRPTDPPPDTPPAPAPPVPDVPERTQDTRADDTLRCWTFALTQRSWDHGVLVLSATVGDCMLDAGLVGAPLQVQIIHPGVPAELRQQPVTLSERRLTGLTWPPQLFVGMQLVAAWSLDGGGYFISVEGIPLDEPLIVDGIPLDYAFDEEVLLRSWGLPRDLQEADDTLTPAQVLTLLRRHALRAASGPGVPSGLVLYLPWPALVQAVTAHAGDRGMADLLALPEAAFATEIERCVDGLRLRSTMAGSVLVEWGVGDWRDDETGYDGPYRQPRTVAQRGDIGLDALCVTLRLAAKPSGRPSLKPRPFTGLGASLSTRRGHSRVLTRGTPSARKRAELLAWADARGIPRNWLHPRATFVAESEVRRPR